MLFGMVLFDMELFDMELLLVVEIIPLIHLFEFDSNYLGLCLV